MVLKLHKFTSTRELGRWVHKVALNMFFGALSVNSFLVFHFFSIHMFVLLDKISNIHLFKHIIFWVASWWYLRYLSTTSWNWRRLTMILVLVDTNRVSSVHLCSEIVVLLMFALRVLSVPILPFILILLHSIHTSFSILFFLVPRSTTPGWICVARGLKTCQVSILLSFLHFGIDFGKRDRFFNVRVITITLSFISI